MSRPTLELADIFRQHGPAYRQAHPLPLYQHRLMQAIETCRTEVLGGSLEWCDHCQYTHTVYRSCRNRHCPKCQGLDRKSTRLNSSHVKISYAVFCLKKKNTVDVPAGST